MHEGITKYCVGYFLQELLVMVDCPEQGKYESEVASEYRISVSELSAECFHSGHTTLSNISFNIKEGQILSVVGPQRSGKVSGLNFYITRL